MTAPFGAFVRNKEAQRACACVCVCLCGVRACYVCEPLEQVQVTGVVILSGMAFRTLL